MGDISKININETEYNIKDAVARQRITIYRDIADVENANLSTNQYLYLADGSLWYAELNSDKDENGINIITVNGTTSLELQVEKPLKVDYLLHGGQSFVKAVKKGFELSNELVLSPGTTYEITGGCVEIPQNCTLRGGGWTSTHIECNNSTFKRAAYSAGETGSLINNYYENILIGHNATLTDVHLGGGNGNTVAVTMWGQMPNLINCWFEGVGQIAVYRIGNYNSNNTARAGGNLTHCNIYGNYIHGVDIESTNDFFIKDLIVSYGNYQTITTDPDNSKDWTIGIFLKNKVQAVCINGCDVMLYDRPIYTSASAYEEFAIPEHNFFTDCMFDSGIAALLTNSRNLIFTNCWFSNGRSETGDRTDVRDITVDSGYGCYIRNCNGIMFNNTTFMNCGSWGCFLETSAKNCTFNGCTFGHNSYSWSGCGGIKTHGYSTAVNGCLFSDEIADSTTGTYGIMYTGNSQYGCYEGNVFAGVSSPVSSSGSYIMAGTCNSVR